jgi:branched-chain amino acid transport system permease protein
VLGGYASWAGPIVGAVLLTSLPELLRGLKEQREIVNGIVLMLAIIYLPRGIADPRFWRLSFGRKPPADAQVVVPSAEHS